MKIIIVIITGVFLLLSCTKKTPLEQKQTSCELPYSSFAESPLHPDLLKAWAQYREFESGKDGINDTAICYYINFHTYKSHSIDDSLVSISFIQCDYIEKYTENGYKGMTNIDSYYIAMLDPENIGKDFYNSKLLIQREISEFKCIKTVNGKVIEGSPRVMTGLAFKIKNNRIEFEEDPKFDVKALR